MHQNLAVILRMFNYSKNSFIVLVPGRQSHPAKQYFIQNVSVKNCGTRFRENWSLKKCKFVQKFDPTRFGGNNSLEF